MSVCPCKVGSAGKPAIARALHHLLNLLSADTEPLTDLRQGEFRRAEPEHLLPAREVGLPLGMTTLTYDHRRITAFLFRDQPQAVNRLTFIVGDVLTVCILVDRPTDAVDDKTRPTLVDWMTAADNPFFARAAVNRMWAYFFGVGLVDQLDGPGDENRANYTELLDELAREFVVCKYDVKVLIRAIVASQTYQRASVVSHPSQPDIRLFARMPLRGLSPEQLFDSLAVATEYQDTAPVDPRASFLGGRQSPRAQFLAKFPAQDQKTDYQTSILQALYLMNNDFIADQTSVQKNRTLATLADQRTSTARKVESLYLVVLSRKPHPEESERFVKYVDAGGPKKALADAFWVLLNSPEFILNH